MIPDIGSYDWPKMPLSELAYEVRESYEPCHEESLPYVGLEHIAKNHLQLTDVGDSSQTLSMKRHFRKGDILFGTLRPYFRKVVFTHFDGVCSTDITVIRARNSKDAGFLFYFIANYPFIDYATATSSGTRMPRAKWSLLSRVKWHIPPASIREKITAILSAYDNLVENNLRRIHILEEMARIIYQEWFMNFRFPGHEKVQIVDSPLGKIPEGWEVKKLSDVCSIVMGQSPKSEFYNKTGNGLPFHQGVTNFGSRFPVHRIYCTVEKRIADIGDILLSIRAPVGRINIADRRLIVGRGLCAIHNRNGNQCFTYHQLKERFREEDTMGGGTIFKAITKKEIQEIELLTPSNSIMQKFEEICKPIEAHIEILTRKNDNLCYTRDLLLSRLISGEINVDELEIQSGG